MGFTHGYSHWTPVGVPEIGFVLRSVMISPFSIKDYLMITDLILDKSEDKDRQDGHDANQEEGKYGPILNTLPILAQILVLSIVSLS